MQKVSPGLGGEVDVSAGVAPCEASYIEVLTRSSAIVCCGGDGSDSPMASKIEVSVWMGPLVRKDSPVLRVARRSVT